MSKRLRPLLLACVSLVLTGACASEEPLDAEQLRRFLGDAAPSSVGGQPASGGAPSVGGATDGSGGAPEGSGGAGNGGTPAGTGGTPSSSGGRPGGSGGAATGGGGACDAKSCPMCTGLNTPCCKPAGGCGCQFLVLACQ